MPYEIETGIPLPPRRTRLEPLPLDTMNVGDSFLVPSNVRTRSSVGATIVHYVRRNPGKRFTTRGMPDGAIRVWRTE